MTKSYKLQHYPSNLASHPEFAFDKQKHEVPKLSESHLVSKLSGENSGYQRHLGEDISTQRNYPQNLQVRRLEHSDPFYQEIMDDNDKHGVTIHEDVNTKDDLINTKDKIIYGLITAKQVAKFRPCIQDIIVRDR